MQTEKQEEEALGLESLTLFLGAMMVLHGVTLICMAVEVVRGRRHNRLSSKIIEAIE